MREPDVTLRIFQPGDEAAVVDLFNRVFKVQPTTSVPRTIDHWRWKFQENPVGEVHYAIAFNAQGEAIGQFGGIPVRVLIRGEQRTYVQLADHMSDPRYRQGLRRQGIFVRTAMVMAAHYGGKSSHQDSIMFGYPVPANWRIGQRYLRYRFVRLVNYLVRDALNDYHAPPPPGHVEVRRVSRFGSDVDALWQQCAPDFTVATIRKQRYLNWRFADCPDVAYTLLEARSPASTLRGIAILRRDGIAPATATLVDWLVPTADHDAALHLVHEACHFTRAAGVDHLVCWFTENTPWFAFFQRLGFRLKASNRILSSRAYDYSLTPQFLREHWYATMGDMDFV